MRRRKKCDIESFAKATTAEMGLHLLTWRDERGRERTTLPGMTSSLLQILLLRNSWFYLFARFKKKYDGARALLTIMEINAILASLLPSALLRVMLQV